MVKPLSIDALLSIKQPRDETKIMGMLDNIGKTLSNWLNRGIEYDIPKGKSGRNTSTPIVREDFRLRTTHGRQYLTIRRARAISQFVIFPCEGEDDKWKCAALDKLIESVDGMYSNGYFDYCPISSAIDTFNLQTPPSVKQALENLRSIHCVHFDRLTQEVFEAIPRHLTHIFSEGRVPLEVIAGEASSEDMSEDTAAAAPLEQELTDIINDALLALEMAGASPDIMDALNARKIQALGNIQEV